MADIHDHNDLGPVVGQPEPPDGAMVMLARVIALAVVVATIVAGLLIYRAGQ